MITEIHKEPIQLPTTEKYVWKFRHGFLSEYNDHTFDEFLHQKKLHIISGAIDSVLDAQTENLLSFLPHPSKMKDAFKAAERVLLAIKNNEKITIFGDYDVDGTTSCALLYEFFALIGKSVDIYIPDRLIEGYGLNPIGLQKCVDAGANLIITVDNGISAFTACALANDMNIDVIITDHHDLPPTLPHAFAILNPKQKDCEFGFPMLAGAGVALYLMIAIRALLKKENSNLNINLRYFLDYVAIGTIADLAPLTGVNHILCKVGLEVLNENIKNNNRIGLTQLLKFAGWNEDSKVDAYDIGFKIGPRLNAAGRLGNALNSVTVLTTKNASDAHSAAEFLHQENANRQTLQKEMTAEALAMAKDAIYENAHAIVLHKPDWHPGVVGLVASRVLEHYYKPTIILGTHNGKLKGSGRSTHAFDLFHVLDPVRSELVSFGGHYHAIGVTLEIEKLNWFRQYLSEQAHLLIAQTDRIPILRIDGILPIAQLNLEFLSRLEMLEPFGQANPEPYWLVGPGQIRNIYRIGKDHSHGHAKITLVDKSGSCKLTVFREAHKFEQFLETGTDIYVVVQLRRRVWQSKIYLDILIVDFAPVVYLKEEKIQLNVIGQDIQHERVL